MYCRLHFFHTGLCQRVSQFVILELFHFVEQLFECVLAILCYKACMSLCKYNTVVI